MTQTCELAVTILQRKQDCCEIYQTTTHSAFTKLLLRELARGMQLRLIQRVSEWEIVWGSAWEWPLAEIEGAVSQTG